VGIQEKQTFIQAFSKPASVHSAIMALPAAIQLLLLITALAVMYHHAPQAAPAHQPAHQSWRQQQGMEVEDEDQALVGAGPPPGSEGSHSA